jgi:hypothetical protein
MKYIVAYSVWNKVDMLAWLLSGVVENFNPADTEVVFHFDACSDDSVAAFEAVAGYWLTRPGFRYKVIVTDPSGPQAREVGGHNKILRYAMEETDAEFIIIAQDDQRFNKPIVDHLVRLSDTYGDTLGVITGRDGYEWGYAQLAGSFWSESAGLLTRLQHGDWLERSCLNTGPLVYTRNVVTKTGYQDEQFCAFYAWDDYALRAKKLGFVNGVLGMDITHAKFGRVTATWWYDGEWKGTGGKDMDRLKQKHGL